MEAGDIVRRLCDDFKESASDSIHRYCVLFILLSILDGSDTKGKRYIIQVVQTSGMIEVIFNLPSCRYELKKSEVMSLACITNLIFEFNYDRSANIKDLCSTLSYIIHQSKKGCKEHIEIMIAIVECTGRFTKTCLLHNQDKAYGEAMNDFLKNKSLLTLSILAALHDPNIEGKGQIVLCYYIPILRNFIYGCKGGTHIVQEIRAVVKYIAGFLQSKLKNGCSQEFLHRNDAFEPIVAVLKHFVTYGSENDFKLVIENNNFSRAYE